MNYLAYYAASVVAFLAFWAALRGYQKRNSKPAKAARFRRRHPAYFYRG